MRCTGVGIADYVVWLINEQEYSPEDILILIGARLLGYGNPAATIASQFIAELGPHAPLSKQGAVWQQGHYGE